MLGAAAALGDEWQLCKWKLRPARHRAESMDLIMEDSLRWYNVHAKGHRMGSRRRAIRWRRR